ncbi:E3 ubiquitin-protein ligase IAP-3 [Clonorchis sinensis]|uniref:E3 ubiquitin-protein ligase IAP-3 n=1 Tax=Clonorchis sinensis TaxID=79923 RepID=A0A8T1M4P0_CLOSI|nr:E3 ubiquitin-protein ligase IAP-3 [Clonorchis sinensis]
MNCFRNLCRTLEEVFSTTPQTEEELDYASATLILGIIQIYSRSPLYASHRARLESFPDQQASPTESTQSASGPPSALYQRAQAVVRHPSANELASAGFFHTGSGDETVCPACGLGLRDWQPTDQPEACHLAFSVAELSLATEDGSVVQPVPSLPCLYLAVRRLLASELPLARKSLAPAGFVQSICTLPGVISPPTIRSAEDRFHETVPGFASLADRLRAIARIMSSPPSPQGWPIENARALGHSDDLIVLGLWRLQTESVSWGLACPSNAALRLDPQATADLLRSILRLQESFAASLRQYPIFEPGSDDGELDGAIGGGSDTDLTAEDAETAALSRCRYRRVQPSLATTPEDATSSPCQLTLAAFRSSGFVYHDCTNFYVGGSADGLPKWTPPLPPPDTNSFSISA